MNVCLVSRYFDFRNAGVGRVGFEIRNGLTAQGHSTTTVSTNGASLYSYFVYTAAQIPFRLPRGADVYHAISPMEAIWLPKDKSVVTFHDLFQITDPDKLGSGLGYSRWKNFVGRNYFALAAHIAKRCKGIVAVSNKTQEDLIEYLGIPEDRIHVIRSGIRPDLKVLRKRSGVKTIGYLGQLDRRKRVDLLITAFRKYKNDIELLIAGTGADEIELKALAAGDPRIKFLGRIPDGELVDFYNRIDAFMFPTWLEGYGLPIIEAMACQRPVIVLDDASLPIEISRRCVSVETLEHLFANPSYFETRCTVNNYESNYRWAKTHKWETTVSQYLELYEEVSHAKQV